MKNLNISFETQEFLKIEEQKGSRNWRNYILQLVEENKNIEKLQRANQFLQNKLIELSNECEKLKKNSLAGEKKVLEVPFVTPVDSETDKNNP